MLHHFRLNIASNDYLRFYQASSKFVQARVEEGLLIRLPAKHLRPHATHDGIKGLFELKSSEQGRFITLRKIS